MTRLAKEMYLKFFFKLHNHEKAKKMSSYYSKGLMILSPDRMGNLINRQIGIGKFTIVKDILEFDEISSKYCKKLYRDMIKDRRLYQFRPLEELKRKELKK